MAAFVVALVVSLVGIGMIFVQPQERGVVVSAISPKGYREQALQPGLNWIIPGLENVVYYPVLKQNYTMSIAPQEGNIIGDDSITARTADGQQILIDASVIYHIDPNEVISIHIDWQDRYSDEFIRPVARAVIRDAVSQFGVEEVYSSRRDQLTEEITKFLILRLEENGLVLDQFLLRNITFSEEYAASVEQKQIAEQTAQQAVFVVEQRKQEAEQERQRAQGLADAAVIAAKGEAEARVINAEAEANALNLIAEALRDKPELLTYQYITKLTPSIQTMLLPSNSPFLFPLPEMQPVTTPTTVTPPTTTILPPVEEPAP
jgi:regulator of protease activity HflC (stomatin/prohibitin superfamily)